MTLTLVRPHCDDIEIHQCSLCADWARDDECEALGWTPDGEGGWACEGCADDSGDYSAPWR